MSAEGESKDSGLIASETAVNVRCSNGSKFSVMVALKSTVDAFKILVECECQIPVDQQRLIYKGRILKDDQTLSSYGLEAGHTIHLVRKFPAETATQQPQASANTGAPTTDPVAAATPADSIPGVGFRGVVGLPEMEQVQQQLTNNPNMMREIMNLPAFQSLINNPELMRGMIMSNPQMRDIVDRNPDLAHILNDPGFLRQTLEAARNPELMREMMRNTDRAMSNIEASPEGFNMLRRMYENVQEPFLSAATVAGGGGNDSRVNQILSLLGNENGDRAREEGSANNNNNNPPAAPTAATATTLTAPNVSPLPNPWGNTGGGTESNNASRANGGDGRTAISGGLPPPGMQDVERMFPGLPDPNMMNQMLQNPSVSQMMQTMLSNPQYLNQVLNFSPQLRSMVDMNPSLRDMMQNPDFLRHLASPEAMQQMMAFQQMLLSNNTNIPQQQQSQDNTQSGPTAAAPNGTGLDVLMNMLGGLSGGAAAANTTAEPPEQLYSTQLSQLQEMGFFDTAENIRVLRSTAGNVNAAVERLLRNSG